MNNVLKEKVLVTEKGNTNNHYTRMATTYKGLNAKNPSRMIHDVAKRATTSRESARQVLRSAGIMTAKGNLSPKYR